jgi:uncharacterized protein YbaR (Trm112 family)
VHILLTDILTCPRCGPEYGLILLADRMSARRVLDGSLGCANCREKYPVRDGVVVFVTADEAATPHEGAAGAAPAAGQAGPGEGADDAALRLAALMGVTQGPGYVLIAGPATRHADTIAAMIEDIEVVAVAAPAQSGSVRHGPGTNLLEVVRPLPIASARMDGVALSGGAADSLLEEGCRVLAPLGRLVLEDAPADAAARLEACGLRVVAHEAETIVAVNRHAVPRTRPGPARA